jgi:hypothetical protein
VAEKPHHAEHADLPELGLPPQLYTESGEERRLGVEIEFGDLSIKTTGAIITSLYGGKIKIDDPYRLNVENTRLGDFLVELDAVYAHPQRPTPKSDEDGLSAKENPRKPEFLDLIAETIGDLSKSWVPMEIACPPVAIRSLPALETLVKALRDYGATGTGRQIYYAFGCQLNPELASLEIGHVLGQFKAWLLLEDWMREKAGQDLSRRLTAFANPFPRDYACHVLADRRPPQWDQFVEDYLRENATRNRDLDMLPLFAHIDEDYVKSLGDVRIKARPTFHYRVPDSRVDEPGWCLTTLWNDWLRVENLAADRPMTEAMTRKFLAKSWTRSQWADEVSRWIAP